MKSRFFWLVLFFITCGAFFRFYQLGQVPVSLYWDEMAILADARSIAATGRDIHGNFWLQAIFPSYGDYKLPVFIWFATLSVKIFGATELAVRLPSALAGIGTIIVSIFLVGELRFLLPKDYSLEKLQVAVVAVLSTSFWSIQFSRTGFEAHIGQFFLVLSVLFILKARKNTLYLFVSALFGAVAVYTYYSVRFVWPVIFLVGILSTFLPVKSEESIKEIFLREKKKILFSCVSVLLFLVLLIPMVKSPLYDASQKFRLSSKSIFQNDAQIVQANQWREIAANNPIDKIYFHRALLTTKELLKNYSQHLSLIYLFFKGDSNLRHGTGEHGLFASILLIPFILGVLFLLNRSKVTAVFLGTWWLVSLLPASVPLEVPHALRSLNSLFPIALIISFGLVYLFEKYKKIFIVSCIVFLLQFISYWSYYMTIYPVKSAESWQDGYKELAVRVMELKPSIDEISIEYPDQRLFLWFIGYPFIDEKIVTAIEKKNYMVNKIDTIKFQNYAFEMLPTAGHKLLLIGTPEELSGRLMQSKRQPDSVQYITNSAGKPVFMLASFNFNL